MSSSDESATVGAEEKVWKSDKSGSGFCLGNTGAETCQQ